MSTEQIPGRVGELIALGESLKSSPARGGKVGPNWYQGQPGYFTIGWQAAGDGKIAVVYVGLGGTPQPPGWVPVIAD